MFYIYLSKWKQHSKKEEAGVIHALGLGIRVHLLFLSRIILPPIKIAHFRHNGVAFNPSSGEAEACRSLSLRPAGSTESSIWVLPEATQRNPTFKITTTKRLLISIFLQILFYTRSIQLILSILFFLFLLYCVKCQP